jgi:hypothetical protein
MWFDSAMMSVQKAEDDRISRHLLSFVPASFPFQSSFVLQ